MRHFPSTAPELRQLALQVLLQTDPEEKCRLALAIADDVTLNGQAELSEPDGIPGRPVRPELVPPGQVGRRAMHTVEGRAVLIHALAHIELNAINLAADILWRFAGLPEQFYRDWLRVMKEEAYHFQLLSDHLQQQGYHYGDFTAHNSLWEMAAKTRQDLIARLALVPRTLEARGLDVTPGVAIKLAQAGDARAAEILGIIYRDEIGHVAIGNRWYLHFCTEQGLDPVALYPRLALQYKAPRLRGPFNLEARRTAGFSDKELLMMQQADQP
ncbi:ferritin-like domain-containing protein [Undibacterium rugosum]|uniref:ferritin-like domain-containing protein n=1 Tax=Undibacterium rugosum TaxID=2762291 RepID=UPI001B8129C6|nr:ferritin-like domain-containing protein [Undibacterium rugosum]MBR7778941.1 ferritin-like domain-containing protein [Undibacterium rugosum]